MEDLAGGQREGLDLVVVDQVVEAVDAEAVEGVEEEAEIISRTGAVLIMGSLLASGIGGGRSRLIPGLHLSRFRIRF